MELPVSVEISIYIAERLKLLAPLCKNGDDRDFKNRLEELLCLYAHFHNRGTHGKE